MRRFVGCAVTVIVILSLLISGISCSTPSTQTPETPSVEEKSDTEQIIDTVIASIVAIGKGESAFEYWYEGFEPRTESTGEETLVQIFSYNCYEQDGQVTYDFPTIQENLAVFDVVIHHDIEKNIFRFNLKKYSQTGWRITDIRLIYTENTMMQRLLSR